MGLKNRITGHFTKDEPQSLSKAGGGEVTPLLLQWKRSALMVRALSEPERSVAEDSSKADGNDRSLQIGA